MTPASSKTAVDMHQWKDISYNMNLLTLQGIDSQVSVRHQSALVNITHA